MSYNHAYGGTIDFPQEKWAGWYQRWLGAPEGKRFYRYILADGEFVGEAAYYYDEDRDCTIADVIVLSAHRGKGYGKAALLRLCEAAKENGVTELYDDIAIDNPSVSLFLRCGFTEAWRNDEVIMVKKNLVTEN